MSKSLRVMGCLLCGRVVTAQTVHEIRDSVKIYFRQGRTELVPELRGNQSSLNQIIKRLRNTNADTLYRLREVEVVGAASPEGSIPLNRELSRKRADVLFNRNRTRENEEQSSRAALTLHAIRETEMFAVIEAQVENKAVIEELMGQYLDEEGNPKPVRSGTPPKNESGKDWKTLIA